MKRSYFIYCLSIFPLFIFEFCDLEILNDEAKREVLLSIQYDDVIGPLVIKDIVYNGFRGSNHLQGMSFDANTLYLSNTKQLLSYDLVKRKVFEGQSCKDMAPMSCKAFHFGDPSFYDGSLWVPLSTAKAWEREVTCTLNKVLLYPEGNIDKESVPISYFLDYPGHIGAMEIMDGKLFVSGKNIDSTWPHDDNCHKDQLVYIYTIEDLKVNICNVHSGLIKFKANGRNGIQNLARFDDSHLLVSTYKCEDDPNYYVYRLNVENGAVSLFQNENWPYGIALSDSGLLYFGKDNRKSTNIYVFGLNP